MRAKLDIYVHLHIQSCRTCVFYPWLWVAANKKSSFITYHRIWIWRIIGCHMWSRNYLPFQCTPNFREVPGAINLSCVYCDLWTCVCVCVCVLFYLFIYFLFLLLVVLSVLLIFYLGFQPMKKVLHSFPYKNIVLDSLEFLICKCMFPWLCGWYSKVLRVDYYDIINVIM